MNTALNPAEMLDSLSWYSEMGVDICVENTPQVLKAAIPEQVSTKPTTNSHSPLAGESNRSFSDSVGGQSSHSASPKTPLKNTPHQNAQERFGSHSRGELAQAAPLSPNTPPASIIEAITEARALADGATDLAALEAAVRGFNGCALKKTATNTVFAQGVPQSRLMFIGEAPGADEDRNGVPFCGASGQLLDKMLSFIGLKRAENFYITNTLFWRPPGNRQPTTEELAICRPFVEKHIALVNPKILVLVGGTATSSMLKDTRGITRLRGQVFRYQNEYMAEDVPVHVIYHPSYLLRQPLAKKQAWGDLLQLKEALSAS